MFLECTTCIPGFLHNDPNHFIPSIDSYDIAQPLLSVLDNQKSVGDEVDSGRAHRILCETWLDRIFGRKEEADLREVAGKDAANKHASKRNCE